MNTLRAAWWIASKDVRIERNTGDVLSISLLFAMLVAVLASLAFYTDTSSALMVAPGVLWIAVAFTGTLAMTRLWLREREADAMDALLLSPIPRASVYLGKTLSALMFMLITEFVLSVMVIALFHLDQIMHTNWPRFIGWLVTLLGTGTLGFVAAGTLFAALGVHTRVKDLALSVVVFPLTTPALLAGVVATRELFAGASDAQLTSWLSILLAFDLMFLAAGLLMTENLLEE